MLLRQFILSFILEFSYSAYTNGISNLSIIASGYPALDIGFTDSTSFNQSQMYGVYMVNSSCPRKYCGFCIKYFVGSYKRTSMVNSWGILKGVAYSCPYNLKEFTIQRCPSLGCETYIEESGGCVFKDIPGSACTGYDYKFIEDGASVIDFGYHYITLDFPVNGLRDVYFNVYLVERCYPLELRNITKIKMYTEDEYGIVNYEAKISMREYCSDLSNQILLVRCPSEDYCPTPVDTCAVIFFDPVRRGFLDVVCKSGWDSFFQWFGWHTEYIWLPFCFIGAIVGLIKCLKEGNKSENGEQSPQPNGETVSSPDPPPQTSNLSNFQSTTQFSTPFIGNHSGAAPPPTYEDVLQMDYTSAYAPPKVYSNKLGDNYKTEYSSAFTFS